MSAFVQAISSGLALGALYAVLGVSFVVIHRVTGVVNLTQGALAVLGAYVMSSVVGHLPWLVAVLVSAVASALTAAVIGFTVLSAKVRLEYSPIIMTLGLAIASQGVFVLVWGDIPRTYPPISRDAFQVLGAFVLPQQVLLLGTVILILVVLHLFFVSSYLGKALTAAALNPRSAQLVGVNLLRAGIVSFAIAGLVAGLAGSISGALVPVTPESHLALAVVGFAAGVCGNLHSPTGALLGGLGLGQLTSFVATYGLPQYQEVVALTALVLVLLVRTLLARRGGVLS